MICSAVKLISFQLGTCDCVLDYTQLSRSCLYPSGSLSHTPSRQCHAFLPPYPLLYHFLFLFSLSISSSLSVCPCSTGSRFTSCEGSDWCSVSSTMETQSGSKGEELKEKRHTRAADAKEDLQESRHIERFDIPLTNLKSMFEKPPTQST
ncbi:xin actin-binding repeat-containing protein 2 isoform X1, partial [Tachysurus ichikawai]